MPKELSETLVMTTCKCRGNEKNLVMTRPYLEDIIRMKVALEQKRIIDLLENTFLPLDYGSWQGDELFDEIIKTIKVGNNESV